MGLWLFGVLSVRTAQTRQLIGDWSFSVAAAKTLASSRWLQVYVEHPSVQTGPLTIGLGWLLSASAVRIAIMLSGLAVMGMLITTGSGRANARWRLTVGGTVLFMTWPQLGLFGHLDDALVMVLATAGVVATLRQRSVLTGALAGVALAVKPTAVFLLALALPSRVGRYRPGWRPLVVALAIAGVIWAPFVLTSGTLDAMRPTVAVQPDSVPSLFAATYSRSATWHRVLQLIAVVSISVAAQWFRGPTSVVWVGMATRLLLDPATWPYYTPGVVLGALIWEVYESESRVPWATVLTSLLLLPATVIGSAELRLWMRMIACIGALVVVFAHRPAAVRERAMDQLDSADPLPAL